MKKAFALLTFIVLSSGLFAQEYLSNEEKVTEHANQVTKYLEKKEFEKAFNLMGEYWSIPRKEVTELEEVTVEQLTMLSIKFGGVIGSEFIREEKVKNLLIRKTYVLKYEKHMIRILYTYYRNDVGWRVNTIKWDDKISELFD